MNAYAELCTISNFTFLTGASHPEELITRAAELRLHALAITDRNSVAGVVRAFSALKELTRLRDEAGEDTPLPRLIPGARIVLQDSAVEWLALPKDCAAWSRLTRLLTSGKRRAPKGQCHLTRADLIDWGAGMALIAMPPDPLETPVPQPHLRQMQRHFPGQCFLGAAPVYDGRDPQRLDHLAGVSHTCGLPMVAVGNVLMHRAHRRPLADVLTCLREGCTIDQIGTRRLPHGEHRLKSARRDGAAVSPPPRRPAPQRRDRR